MSRAHAGPQRPPPLQALRALEAAVRHESYTLAADELAITQSAVSHHLRDLELRLGQALFARSGGRMVPTAAARAMAARIRDGLLLLDSALEDAPRRRGVSQLHLSVLPSFATKWLVPRLGDLHARQPTLALTLATSLALTDFRRDGVDAAIRYGAGRWDGTDAVLLAREEVFAVASPRYAQGRLPLTPQALRADQMIGNAFQPWAPWFAAAGVSRPEPRVWLSVSDAALAIDAAAAGQGIALARELLARDDLAAGRVVRLFDIAFTAPGGYWLVWPRGSRKRAAIEVLRDWLLAALAPPGR